MTRVVVSTLFVSFTLHKSIVLLKNVLSDKSSHEKKTMQVLCWYILCATAALAKEYLKASILTNS